MKKPPCLVWLLAVHRFLRQGESTMAFLVFSDKSARAIKVNANAYSAVFPLTDASRTYKRLALIDGAIQTDSSSNALPSQFGKSLANPSLSLDAQRYELTLELTKACLGRTINFLGVCRGLLEINVALNGSLQQLHDLCYTPDHPESEAQSHAVQYAAIQEVGLVGDSVFARRPGAKIAQANSLLAQGIDRLAQGLRALARRSNDLVEAFDAACRDTRVHRLSTASRKTA